MDFETGIQIRLIGPNYCIGHEDGVRRTSELRLSELTTTPTPFFTIFCLALVCMMGFKLKILTSIKRKPIKVTQLTLEYF